MAVRSQFDSSVTLQILAYYVIFFYYVKGRKIRELQLNEVRLKTSREDFACFV